MGDEDCWDALEQEALAAASANTNDEPRTSLASGPVLTGTHQMRNTAMARQPRRGLRDPFPCLSVPSEAVSDRFPCWLPAS